MSGIPTAIPSRTVDAGIGPHRIFAMGLSYCRAYGATVALWKLLLSDRPLPKLRAVGVINNLSATELEKTACAPIPVDPSRFNPNAKFPNGCTVAAVRISMEAFIDFLGFLNQQLLTRDLLRLEMLMMPANFSSLVGEFIVSSIPKHCPGLVKNRFHNGHPDLIPTGHYLNDRILHGPDGIEVKASRYSRAWQGHNAEECWLMVFVFKANSSSAPDAAPVPFEFRRVSLARLEKIDWKFAGRSSTSRRTITASVTKSGEMKLRDNWIYEA